MGRLDLPDVYRDEDWPAERYSEDIPRTLLRALADAPVVPEEELKAKKYSARYGKAGQGRRVRLT